MSGGSRSVHDTVPLAGWTRHHRVPAARYQPEPTSERVDEADSSRVLVERVQAGDGEAFGLIYDRYFDTVFRFVYFRVRDRQLAEDLTADTFLRAIKRIDSFTWQGRDIAAWLIAIARNLVADHFRSAQYRRELISSDVVDAVGDTRSDLDWTPDPEAAALGQLTADRVLEAVKQLNPEQQECISLRFLHEFSVAETAQAMDRSPGAVKALQYRAVRALERFLPSGLRP